MKKKIMLFVGLMIALLGIEWLSIADDFEKCLMCGMDASKSETKFTAKVEGNSKVQSGEYAFCCLRCLLTFEKRIETGRVYDIKARDYDTGKMFDATQGFFLIESEKLPQGSMVPFMLIFSDQEIAGKYQKVYGGKIVNWYKIREYTLNIKKK